jgi:hypothetical protein
MHPYMGEGEGKKKKTDRSIFIQKSINLVKN